MIEQLAGAIPESERFNYGLPVGEPKTWSKSKTGPSYTLPARLEKIVSQIEESKGESSEESEASIKTRKQELRIAKILVRSGIDSVKKGTNAKSLRNRGKPTLKYNEAVEKIKQEIETLQQQGKEQKDADKMDDAEKLTIFLHNLENA